MSIITKITSLFFKTDQSSYATDEELVEMNVCPNCWGKQEYDNQFKDYLKDKTKSNVKNDKTQKKAFVEQFIETNITGIKLINEKDHLVCSACNARYKTDKTVN